MRAARVMAMGSIAFATLFSVTAPAATVGAAGQDGPPTQLDEVRFVCGANERPALGDNPAPRDAMLDEERDRVDDAPSTAATGSTTAPRLGPRGRPFLAVLGAIPLVTYAAAKGSRG